MKAHSRARAWALQGLYAAEMRAAPDHDVVRLLDELFGDLRVSPRNRPYAQVLARLVAANRGPIDARLAAALTNWRLERLGTIDRNLLRLGAAELLFLEDTPPHVVLREIVRLAERYGTPDSPRFVHGVLDAVAREIGRERNAP